MISRRHLLQIGAAAMAVTPLRLAFAAAETDRRLVVLMLRGAMDGLHAVPPVNDAEYARLRGDLAVLSEEALPLDGRFALHPALKTMKGLFDGGEVAVVHAVATPYRDRSHFDGQDLLENGSATPHGLGDGWLNRLLPLLPGAADRRLALAVGPEIPLLLRGGAEVASWAPDSLPAASDDFLERVSAMYVKAPNLSRALSVAMESGSMAAGIDPGTGGGRRQNAAALAAVAGKMLAQAQGPRIAVLDVPGWDTHSGQQGRMTQALSQLDAAIAALKQNLAEHWPQSLVVTLTEFGRTAVPNGSGGTDHGTASAVFLLGGAVQGGKVLGDWPGLAEADLYEGRDLAPTTDLRAVLMGALGPHFGVSTKSLATQVFVGASNLAPLNGLVRV